MDSAGPATKPPASGGACNKCHLYRSKPKIPMYAPYNIHVEKGRQYKWCTCGLSKTQPWCDDSHKGTAFKPLRFTPDFDTRYTSICGCKYTSSPPYCDGSHSVMPADPDYTPCRCPPDW